MKGFVSLLFLLLICLTSNAQTPIRLSSDGTEVTMPLNTYRKMREKFFLCDTALATKDSLLSIRDSMLVVAQQQNASLQRTIVLKDTTIHNLDFQLKYVLAEREKGKSIFKQPLPWLFLSAGITLGVLIAK